MLMTHINTIHPMRRLVRLFGFLPLLMVAFMGFTSCSEESDEVEEYPDWQAKNTAEWNSIYANALQRIAAGDTSWKIIRSWSLEDTLTTDNTHDIVVHVNTAGTGSGCPLYTDSVRLHSRGHLLPSTSYASGYEFDNSWGTATSAATAAPAQYLVSQLSDGYATALQNMHIGDDWDVYVPWPLGYGTTGSGSIPGYSVLIWNMQLVSYFRAGQDVPDFKAKEARWTEQ